jgi:hypothetical protein
MAVFLFVNGVSARVVSLTHTKGCNLANSVRAHSLRKLHTAGNVQIGQNIVKFGQHTRALMMTPAFPSKPEKRDIPHEPLAPHDTSCQQFDSLSGLDALKRV